MFALTERLLLRPGWPEDAPALAATIGDEAVVRNLAHVPWPYGLADAERFLALPESPRLPRLLAFTRGPAAPVLIGGIGLHHGGAGEVELGYWFGASHWGRGHATEAARAMVRLARDGLRHRRLVAGHFADNPASGRVLAKLGFRISGGIVPRFGLARGGTAPFVPMALDLTPDAVVLPRIAA